MAKKQFNLETELTGKIDDLTAKLNRANQQIGKFKKQQKKHNSDLKGAFKGTSSAIQDVGNAVSNGGISSLPALFKASKTAIKSATVGVKGFTKALIGTGIGAVVVAIGSLVAAFTASEEGAAKFQKVWMPLTVLFDNFIDLLADVGEGLIYAFDNPREAVKALWKTIKENLIVRFEALGNLFTSIKDIGVGTFNLIGASIKNMWSDQSAAIARASDEVAIAAKDMGKALLQASTGLSDDHLRKTNDWLQQNNKEMEQASVLAEKIYQTDLKEREQLKKRAELEKEIAQLKLESREAEVDDPTKAIKLLKEAQALEDSLLQTDLEIATARKDIQVEKNTYARSNKENLDAEAEAIARVNSLEKTRLDQQAATQRRLNSLQKQAISLTKSLRAEDEKLSKFIDKPLKQAGELHTFDVKAELDVSDFNQLDNYEQKIKINAELNEESFNATIERAEAITSAVSQSFDSLGTNISESLGLAEEGLEGFVGVMAQTVMQLLAMSMAEAIGNAIKGATLSASFSGPSAVFVQPAFIATAVSGVLSAFAAIPKFEWGGIVGGSSFSGDKVLARVNSGEMILNKGQQANLFSMLNNTQGSNSEVKFKIEGTNLVGVLDKFKRKNKIMR